MYHLRPANLAHLSFIHLLSVIFVICGWNKSMVLYHPRPND